MDLSQNHWLVSYKLRNWHIALNCLFFFLFFFFFFFFFDNYSRLSPLTGISVIITPTNNAGVKRIGLFLSLLLLGFRRIDATWQRVILFCQILINPHSLILINSLFVIWFILLFDLIVTVNGFFGLCWKDGSKVVAVPFPYANTNLLSNFPKVHDRNSLTS